MRQTTAYSTAQIGLHWLIAALVLFQLLFGDSMTALVEATEEGTTASPTDVLMSGFHFWFGAAILILALIRLGLRLWQGAPPPLATTSPLMALAARVLHWLFYALLIVVPVLGLLAYYLGDPFGELHAIAKPAFIILIVIHAGAALIHQFFLKDGTLMRMLRPAR